MYEERKNNFSIRDVVIQLLLVVLFVFIMIWIFPTKGYLASKYANKDDINNALTEKLQALYGRLYADNVESMKSAAQGYFTTERLPKNVGDSITLTLGEMLEKKLVLEFKDSNNKTCSATDSYVKITKMDNEYQMKVSLSCSDYSDYIIVYMGCYSYCETNICEVKKPTTPVNKPSKPTEPNKPTDPKPIVKKYNYEYRLVKQNEYSSWGNWSTWSVNKVLANTLTQVETKTENKFIGYEQVWGITGYVNKPYTAYESRLTGYKNVIQKKQIGTIPDPNGSKDIVATTKSTANTTQGSATAWSYVGTITSKSALSTYVSATATVKYTYVSDKTTVDCSNGCQNVTTYYYKKYTRTFTSGQTTYSCPSGYQISSDKKVCNKYGNVKMIPVYKDITVQTPVYEQVPVTKYKEEAVYGYKNGNAKYETTTLYRFRKRTLISEAQTIYKWSASDNDSSLLNQGYSLTGNKKEV